VEVRLRDVNDRRDHHDRRDPKAPANRAREGSG